MAINVASMIDHTLLKPETTKEQVIDLAKEAKEHKFASVCVNPAMVETAYEILTGTEVKVCTVIGFPLGASTSETKAFETEDAIKRGAEEVDMVINIGALKAGEDEAVKKDILAVVEAAEGKALTKVIIETVLLTEEEKTRACRLAVEAGADFVKTSTGFAGGGATVADVKVMKEAVGNKAKVKASGGVKNYKSALEMAEAGADRIGTSSGVAIVTNTSGDSKDY
ncbi:deoxyribose-phosphate aldolase [Bacillus sp. FJAT-44742]|uniref:deoxyribose-phosphate aldolase n=1 Tax=Bacillus sp. FJAT-44742 TaxID=2014005 RepID=UPI000C23F08F|nr:deoxyribose-phosphate aldolase [Bacillus sp. FJAT-44742]